MHRHGLRVTFSALLLLAACSQAPTNSVRIGVDVDAGSLDPRLMRDTTAYRLVNLLYDGLVELDGSLSPQPALASRWENPTPTEWLFHLRQNAMFHDGRPVQAEDVVYTLESLLDPELSAPLRLLYAPIARIEALDEWTVRLELDAPYAPLLSYLDVGIVPRQSGPELANLPIGSGPYRFKRWDKGSKIVLESNPTFWKEPPSISELEFIVVPDNTARAQAFEAGDLDIIQSPLASHDIDRLSGDERFRHARAEGPALTYLNINTARPPLNDVEFRRALAHLIDQETILSEIYQNVDENAQSILLPISWAYDPSVRQPSHDPDEAGRLLDELGWKDRDGDGFRERNEKKLSLELGTHSEDLNRVQTIEYLQNVFRQHGIEAAVRISDWPSFSLRRDDGDFDIILLGWTQLVDPDRVFFEQLHSRGGLNWGGFDDASLDQWLERGRTLVKQSERADAYRNAASIVADRLPYYILSYQGYQIFYTPRLQDFELDPRGMLRGLTRAQLEPSTGSVR